ncbi:hypothetical protein BTW10_09965 [Chromohalobacter japonicus]|uniref:Uncharacterized protein n=2 Tax=Chromohalobacter TaxID=42054 RepID=A0A1Q8TCK0_9GAMM|nr:hypothetical protein [Chromohalobacter japonicus]OLO11404.1 hypothetical protein BTW10_09965 [Chromohalobacter japonicus]
MLFEACPRCHPAPGAFFVINEQQENDMGNYLDKYRDNLDVSIVVSTLTSAVVIGLAVYGMRKAGMNTAAKIVSGGK